MNQHWSSIMNHDKSIGKNKRHESNMPILCNLNSRIFNLNKSNFRIRKTFKQISDSELSSMSFNINQQPWQPRLPHRSSLHLRNSNRRVTPPSMSPKHNTQIDWAMESHFPKETKAANLNSISCYFLIAKSFLNTERNNFKFMRFELRFCVFESSASI